MEYAYLICACSARIAPIQKNILIRNSISQNDKVCLFDMRLILTSSICTSLSSDVRRSEQRQALEDGEASG